MIRGNPARATTRPSGDEMTGRRPHRSEARRGRARGRDGAARAAAASRCPPTCSRASRDVSRASSAVRRRCGAGAAPRLVLALPGRRRSRRRGCGRGRGARDERRQRQPAATESAATLQAKAAAPQAPRAPRRSHGSAPQQTRGCLQDLRAAGARTRARRARDWATCAATTRASKSDVGALRRQPVPARPSVTRRRQQPARGRGRARRQHHDPRRDLPIRTPAEPSGS